MADENAKIDSNSRQSLTAITDDSNQEIRNLRVNPVTGRLIVSAVITSSNTSIGDTIPGGTEGAVLFLGAGGTLAQDPTVFFYDDTNNRIHFGGNNPQATVHVTGTVRFELGSDAEGDIYYRTSGGNLVRLGIGSAGQVLTVSGGVPAWGAGSGGGGYATIQEDGTPATQRTTMSFNDFFTVTDNGGASRTDITINTTALSADPAFITSLEAGLDLGSIAGTINLGTQVTGVLDETNGGTGQSTISQGDILYGSAANTISKLAKSTSATRYLSNTGTSNNPAWAQVDLSNGVTGQLPVANLATLSDGVIIIGDGVGAPTTLSAFTSSTGFLKHENGGLEFNASAVVKGDLIVGTGAGTMALKNVGTNGQVLTADSAETGGVKWGDLPGLLTATAMEDLTAGDPVGTSTLESDSVALANWYSKSLTLSMDSPRRIAYIGNNTYAAVGVTGGSGSSHICIVEIDRNTMTATEVADSGLYGNIDGINICSLGTVGKFLIVFTNDGVNDGEVAVGTWDGATLVLGTEVTVVSSGDVGECNCCNFGTDRAAVFFGEPTPNGNEVRVITVSGTTPTVAASFSFGDGNWSDIPAIMTQIDTNKFVAVNGNQRARVFEFTAPSTLTAGTIITTLSSSSGGTPWVASAKDGKFMFLAKSPGYSLDYCSVSGTTITIQDSQAVSSVPGSSLINIDSTTFYLYESNNTVATSGIYKVTITGGTTIATPVLVASRVLPTSGGQLEYFSTQGYFVLLNNSTTTNYFIQGMSGNFVGIAQNTVSAGGSVSVKTAGTDTNQTGISPGQLYEVTNGELTPTLDGTVPFKVTGLTTTEVVI